ncbi:unknown [Ruminococcus sp. CAG:579]|nr:unknown [Ruminococcus sp. CAG:579]
MPKPIHKSAREISSGRKSGNPISKLLENHKQKVKQKREKKAMEVSNNIAERENQMLDLLGGINFTRSKLPAEVLEYKSNPEQPYGDIELTSKWLQRELKNSPAIAIDIKELDSQIIEILHSYKNAIDQGNQKEAWGANRALLSIPEVRNKIVSVESDKVNNYLDNASQYLDAWRVLIELSEETDNLKAATDTFNEQYENKKKEVEEKNAALKSKIEDNDLYLAAFAEIHDKTASDDPMKWTEEMRVVRKWLSEQEFNKLTLGLLYRKVQGKEMLLQNNKSKLEIMQMRVIETPKPENENLHNEYKEQLQSIIDECAKMDVEIDEMLSDLEMVEGQLEVFDNAPGAIHLRNNIAREAGRFLEEEKQRQSDLINAQGVNRKQLMDKLGLKTEEEMEILKEQAEKEWEKQVEKMREETEQLTNTNQERMMN